MSKLKENSLKIMYKRKKLCINVNSCLILEIIDLFHVKIKQTGGQSAGKTVWTKQARIGPLAGRS